MNEAANGVCVLGMHRSGTSLVAGVLRQLGIDLGPDEEFLPPDSNNESGYFELKELVYLNNDILAYYGGSWDDGPGAAARLGEVRRARIHPRSAPVFSWRGDFADSPLWGWKDPRTCITLPFWQRLVPGLRYVICVRNPIDVVHSLRLREGEERGLDQQVLDWLRHTASALAYTAERRRIAVHYERFFEDTEREVRGWRGFSDARIGSRIPTVARDLRVHRSGARACALVIERDRRSPRDLVQRRRPLSAQ